MLVHRLAFDHRLHRRLAIVVADEVLERVQVDVLILERVHELVHDGDPDILLRGAVDDVEELRLGVVVADDLLGEDLHEELAQLERVRQESEQLVRHLLASDRFLHRRLVQLL